MTVLIEPDLGRVSGGLRYNRAVADAAHGAITRHALPGTWPAPSAQDDAALRHLAAHGTEPVIVDGLIGCSLREPLEAAVPLIQLVHAPLALANPAARERERANLAAAGAVVTTSHHAADQIRDLYGLDATVAAPGVRQREPASGTATGWHLVCIGALEDNKNQLFLARVLSALAESGVAGWHCTFAGPPTDPAYTQRFEEACAALPRDSVSIVGELEPQAVDDLLAASDLLLLPSQRETFGMVVTEAASAAIPALVSAHTGAEEALAAGRALPLVRQQWVTALTRWLTDTEHREQLRDAAARHRPGLRTWEDTARDLLGAVASCGAGSATELPSERNPQ
ncbi:glycosyltransferase family 4 protein [Kocuria sp. cx-455]|uniref:glycosyltransferase family 4 protein n=1 Tax=Kocuria sp. cx-455 TaxID=2771377 RepID=UPI003D70DAC0